MKNSDVKQWLLRYCHSAVRRAICMWPVTCPEDYEKVGTICYKLIESPSPEPTFLKALATCNKEGSGLAHPTTMSQIDELALFIADKVDWDVHDTADVAIGLNVAFGDASLGDLYEMSAEVHSAVNRSSVEGTQHLFLSVTQNASWVLAPTDFGTTTPFYVCEFHGPLGCWTAPPNCSFMNIQRNLRNRAVFQTLTYSISLALNPQATLLAWLSIHRPHISLALNPQATLLAWLSIHRPHY
ncbi:uncharacterized protein LOC135116065 [Scylla paramamosain]|uniref:uncharacterized protein LOC135116065 n=1 Tax=Scylla paramamosain TaxID=85552 RepID=UPI003083A0B7